MMMMMSNDRATETIETVTTVETSKKVEDEIFFDFLGDMKSQEYKFLGGNAKLLGIHPILNENWENYAHEMVPGLFLGDDDAARNWKFFEDNKIQGVVNVARGLPNHFEDRGIKYLENVQIDDLEDNVDILGPAISSIKFIHDHLNNRSLNVLVHCAMGISRSVSIVCAYLMFRYKWNFDQSLNYIRHKRSRPEPNPNQGFRRQLLSQSNEIFIHTLEF